MESLLWTVGVAPPGKWLWLRLQNRSSASRWTNLWQQWLGSLFLGLGGTFKLDPRRLLLPLLWCLGFSLTAGLFFYVNFTDRGYIRQSLWAWANITSGTWSLRVCVCVCEKPREGERKRARGRTPVKSKLPACSLPESPVGENSVCLRAKRGWWIIKACRSFSHGEPADRRDKTHTPTGARTHIHTLSRPCVKPTGRSTHGSYTWRVLTAHAEQSRWISAFAAACRGRRRPSCIQASAQIYFHDIYSSSRPPPKILNSESTHSSILLNLHV